MNFEINGHQYQQYYSVANGIYLKWTIFVQTIHDLQGEKCSDVVSLLGDHEWFEQRCSTWDRFHLLLDSIVDTDDH